jgi:hypothetical protein
MAVARMEPLRKGQAAKAGKMALQPLSGDPEPASGGACGFTGDVLGF